MTRFLVSIGLAAAFVLALAVLLTLLPRAGRGGRRLAAMAARPPGLDVVLALLTIAPWFAGCLLAGWRGAAGALAGQVIAMELWVLGHELAHRGAADGPRIMRFMARRVGRVRNHVALWATAIALPAFWLIRLAELFVYPLLVWTVDLPRYRHRDWIAVSRHRFDGLVGHDLLWCLYCDWMTGVYSLGAEMLRNVESFWCPIRFSDPGKCERCRLDFPDIDRWVAPDGTMAEVVDLLEQKYGDGTRAWFGHPVRLTVSEGAKRGAEREPA